jgi:hypothetical protein
MRVLGFVLVAALIVSWTAAHADDAGKLNVPPEGLSALFNGKDFNGWKMDERNAEHWRVVDGVIEYDGKGRSLPTDKDYGNFVLMVDWKIQKGGDSGIYLRGKPQVQIWDIDRHREGSGGLWNNRQHERNPLVPADNPVGEWNSFKIELVGDKVTVHLNGKLVVDDTPMDTLKSTEKGPILLQHHGNPLSFRNIFIKELP